MCTFTRPLHISSKARLIYKIGAAKRYKIAWIGIENDVDDLVSTAQQSHGTESNISKSPHRHLPADTRTTQATNTRAADRHTSASQRTDERTFET